MSEATGTYDEKATNPAAPIIYSKEASSVSVPANQPWTIQRIVNWSTTYLTGKGTDTPRLDSELLLCEVLKCKRIDLYMNFDKPVSIEERDLYKAFLRRRIAGEPVAYILCQKEFMGLVFKVSDAVLIPRPDTEILVETALSFLKKRESRTTLDIGTGSGCIPISLAKLGQASGVAWDVSKAALDVAIDNAARHGVGDFNFKIVDALALAGWSENYGQFDLIVSNPPYISQEEKAGLAISVRDYEPATALFAEESGLLFYRVISERAASFLKPSGRLMVEVGWTQAASVSCLLRESGWQDIVVVKDLAGHDRVVSAAPNSSVLEA